MSLIIKIILRLRQYSEKENISRTSSDCSVTSIS